MIQYNMSYKPVYGTESAGTTLCAMCLRYIAQFLKAFHESPRKPILLKTNILNKILLPSLHFGLEEIRPERQECVGCRNEQTNSSTDHSKLYC